MSNNNIIVPNTHTNLVCKALPPAGNKMFSIKIPTVTPCPECGFALWEGEACPYEHMH